MSELETDNAQLREEQGHTRAAGAVRAAFAQTMMSTDPGRAMAAVEDGQELVPALVRFVDAFPEVVGILTVDVRSITFSRPGRAEVSFDLAAQGLGQLSLNGEAVQVDGTWKVARATIAGMLAVAGFPPEG